MVTLHERDDGERADLSARIEAAWNQLKAHLEEQRHKIADEMTRYPTPIPACDAQFNHLLEVRVRVTEELQRLDAIKRDGLAGEHAIAGLDALMRASAHISDEIAQSIRSSLGDVWID